MSDIVMMKGSLTVAATVTALYYSLVHGDGVDYLNAQTLRLSSPDSLTANAGGLEARKADGNQWPHTPAEKEWLRAAMNLLIRRAGEYAANPTTLVERDMADLPSV